MNTDMGEYIVGAYLKVVKNCLFVDYNVRAPGGGMAGLNELDVIGLDFDNQTAYICEVATHLQGMFYGNGSATTIQRIAKKYVWQQHYASEHLTAFPNQHFMFWSPVVAQGATTIGLGEIAGLELVINTDYTACVEALRAAARQKTADVNNPAFRTLQILEHLKH